jgi:MoxR-like ATPase
MTTPFDLFHGDGRQTPELADQLPQPLYRRLTQSTRYLADDGLRDACNVALLLGQPLLLTGEPGTGKSRFAHALASEFCLGDPLVYEVKSTSTAQDLFYHYDALKRFQDIQSGRRAEEAPASQYLTINALGQAILNSLDRADLPPLLHGLATSARPRRSVVLLDEMDKAPRDFPNDLLTQFEDLYFRIPELGDLRLQANPELRPLLVITSNSERDLPDAFLRRCVYYHIPFPNQEKLAEIVASQLQEFASDSRLVPEAIKLFLALRDSSGLSKKPATAELLLWLLTLRQLLGEAADSTGLKGAELDTVERSLSALIKRAEDREVARKVAREVLAQWRTRG